MGLASIADSALVSAAAVLAAGASAVAALADVASRALAASTTRSLADHPEIVMHKGVKPDDVAFFSASEVLTNLAPTIVLPEA